MDQTGWGAEHRIHVPSDDHHDFDEIWPHGSANCCPIVQRAVQIKVCLCCLHDSLCGGSTLSNITFRDDFPCDDSLDGVAGFCRSMDEKSKSAGAGQT